MSKLIHMNSLSNVELRRNYKGENYLAELGQFESRKYEFS